MALTGNSIEEKVWNYLKAKGLNNYAIAGLMGNIYAESGIIANRLEMLCIKRLKENGMTYTDATYTSAVDNGKISKAEFLNPLPGKQYGYGFCQWTSPGRKAGLYDLVKERKVSIGDAEAQLDFLWFELSKSYTSVMSTLKSATSVKEASDVVLIKFECPVDKSDVVKDTRTSYGQKYYKKYATSSEQTNMGGTTMAYDISKVISIAENEIGYLEKASNSNLDSKTANAGSNNYTKYWRDMANLGLGNYQAQYWCACFVAWCFYKAYGLATMQSLLLHKFFINCSTMANLASSVGQLFSSPQVGDVILFYKSSSGYYHTGIVVAVTSSTITTIEGNTSGGSSVISNGGGVAKKTYNRSSLNAKFMRPKYGTSASSDTNTSTPSNSGTKLSNTVSWNGTVTVSELNVRTWAGTSNKTCSFSPLKKGISVGVCDSIKASDGSTWYFIKYNGKYGFVHSSYISKQSTSTDTSTKPNAQMKIECAASFDKNIAGTYKTTANLNLRTGAGTSKSIIITIPSGGTANCYGYYTTSSGVRWYLVTYNTYTGFVSSNYLKK